MPGLERSLRSSRVDHTDDVMDIPPGIICDTSAAPPIEVPDKLTPALHELTASIAHEIKQPLAAIITNAETCLRWLDQEQPQIDKARASVNAIIRSAYRSCDIIGQLCALSAKCDIPRVELNLNDVLQGVVSLITPELIRHQVSLRLDLAANLAPVLGDQIQLQQMISNLLINGIQALASVCDRPRELLIRSLPHDGDQIVVVVQDNGTGIDPRHIDRLFNAFFTTKVGGTGIGLSICRSVVEAHGGRIWASRNDGHGATFAFALPAFVLGANNGASRNTDNVLAFRPAFP